MIRSIDVKRESNEGTNDCGSSMRKQEERYFSLYLSTHVGRVCMAGLGEALGVQH